MLDQHYLRREHKLVRRVAALILVIVAHAAGCGSTVDTGISADQTNHPESYRQPAANLRDLPQLIETLADPTPTDRPVDYFGGYHAKGDVALLAILDLIPELPFMQFVPELQSLKADDIGVGTYYEYVRADPRNRVAFQHAVRAWIDQATNEQRATWGRNRWVPVAGY